ncbi:MAG TPA: hypothetical protein VGL35_10925 [Rhizomicrobium sp.]
MRMFTTGATLSALLLPLAALAANTATPAQAVPAAQNANPLICHYFYHEGDLVRRPTCHTAQEWQHQRLYQQRLIREYQQRALVQRM